MTEKKEEVIDKTEELINSVNFNELAVIKGKQGIFLPLSQPNKSNLIGVKLWEDIFKPEKNSITVKAQDLTILSTLIFNTLEGNPDLDLKNVFVNLHNYEESLDDNLVVEDFNLKNKETVDSLMNIAVPNYDKDKFKDYHLKKVIKYYKWFKEALIIIVEFTENVNKSKKD